MAGVFFELAGVMVIVTGKFRSIIFESNGKYIIGSVFIFLGLYIFILLAQQKFESRLKK